MNFSTEWLNTRYQLLDADDGTDTGNSGEQAGAEQPKAKSFDDILKENPDFQKEFDRRVSKGLDTAKTKWKAEAEAQAAAEKSEAERLAKLTADQRAAEEWKKREAEMTKREQEISRRELKAQAKETLAEKGLPSALIDTLNFTDADSCSASIDAVEKAFRAAVQTGVEDRMKGHTPKGSNTGTKPDYDKMTDAEYYAQKAREKSAK